MITSIVGIVAMIGELAYRFVVDYISNIIVGTILFPINTIQQGNRKQCGDSSHSKSYEALAHQEERAENLISKE